MSFAASISNRPALAVEDLDPLRPRLEHVPLGQKPTLARPNTLSTSLSRDVRTSISVWSPGAVVNPFGFYALSQVW